MGVDYAAARKLIALAARLENKGPALMLGRHRMHVRDRFRDRLEGDLAEHGFGLTWNDLHQPDGFAETFFEALGFPRVEAMDISDFEGAGILHDLNAPVPDALRDRYGLIYDGGTTEHVFDVASCMGNIDAMLTQSGVLAACSPGNGWFNHGFYQFGPELVYGYWKHGCQYDVLSCSMLPVRPRFREVALPDPAERGKRIRMRGAQQAANRVYLYYEVMKTASSRPYRAAMQTDYVRRWSDHDRAAERGETAFERRRQEQDAHV
ncbi:MAG: hypothetical protein AAGG54_12725 [Pseudomonadota bacterium]